MGRIQTDVGEFIAQVSVVAGGIKSETALRHFLSQFEERRSGCGLVGLIGQIQQIQFLPERGPANADPGVILQTGLPAPGKVVELLRKSLQSERIVVAPRRLQRFLEQLFQDRAICIGRFPHQLQDEPLDGSVTADHGLLVAAWFKFFCRHQRGQLDCRLQCGLPVSHDNLGLNPAPQFGGRFPQGCHEWLQFCEDLGTAFGMSPDILDQSPDQLHADCRRGLLPIEVAQQRHDLGHVAAAAHLAIELSE